MKVYAASAAAGLLVGVIYALLGVRSPAPPIVALFGLLGILLGEQVVPLAKRLMMAQPVNMSWWRHEAHPQVFGQLPAGHGAKLIGGTPPPQPSRPAADQER